MKKHLMRHCKTQHITSGQVMCTECEKSFDKEWKLNAHMKVHQKYSCEKCEKSYQYESIKDIHIKVTHNNVKLFCHYYNNEKD